MTVPEPLLDTREVAAAAGVPEAMVRLWKTRRQLTPAGLVPGRGRGGRAPLYRLSDVRPLADAYLARRADRHDLPEK